MAFVYVCKNILIVYFVLMTGIFYVIVNIYMFLFLVLSQVTIKTK